MVQWLVSFLGISLVIAMVCGAIRKDDPKEIFRAGSVLFGYLSIGTIVFCAILYVVLELV